MGGLITLARPPQSWAFPDSHLKHLLTDPWYCNLSLLIDGVSTATHFFFNRRDCLAALFPLTTPSISSPMGLSSDSMPVMISLRDKEIFLADSMQFSLELACRVHGSGAYYLMPTFRGEDVNARHLSQFFHVEVEIIGDLPAIMQLAEEYVIELSRFLLEKRRESIVALAGTTAHVERLLHAGFVFPRIKFDDAFVELREVPSAFELLENGEFRLTEIGERELLRRYGDFLWLTHMPWSTVPFYQGREAGTRSALNADLLAGIGEILGCGERALTADEVRENLLEQNVDRDSYMWYLQMKESREIRTSGFGLGIERFLLWLVRHDDIRDCTLLVRNHGEAYQP